MKIVITGVPWAGKTTVAGQLSKRLPLYSARASDGLMDWFSWSEVSQIAADKLADDKADVIYEGVAMVRALRKCLNQHADVKPCDLVLFFQDRHPLAPAWKPGHERMAKGARRIFAEIESALESSGVIVRHVWHGKGSSGITELDVGRLAAKLIGGVPYSVGQFDART